jgi:hypothetical protein
VPKSLGLLCKVWAPRSLLVTFKLETDPIQMREKACKNILRYDLKYVVANQLQTYKAEASLYVACGCNGGDEDAEVRAHVAAGATELPETHAGEKRVVSYLMKGDVEKLLAQRLVSLISAHQAM